MPNFTTRLGLTKPLTSEAYDVGVFNSNMDLLDAAPANVTICTSSTRPGAPDDGDLIYETDSTNILIRQGGSWKPHNGKAHVCTSSTRPSSSLSFGGMVIFETDTSKLLVRNAANSAWLGVGIKMTQTRFTTTGAGTWFKPAGCTQVLVEVVGGGGGGGGCATTAAAQMAAAGGGGGGGYTSKLIDASMLAGNETINVGGGGAGGTAGANNGSTGSTSRFATGAGYEMNATGGAGGTGSFAAGGPASFQGGAGGVGAGGDINLAGGMGGIGIVTSSTTAALANWGGAAGHMMSGQALSLGASGAGTAGLVYGGGGGGAFNNVSQGTARAGGAGAAGIVIVTEYYW